MLAMNRCSLQRKLKVKFDFVVDEEVWKNMCTFYFICESYIGCDQEYKFVVYANIKKYIGPYSSARVF